MKNNTRIIIIIAAALWAWLFSWAAHAQPLGTAFTYQGRLTDGGNTANGTHEFEFHLYDAADANGIHLGTQTVEEVPVVDGIFTVKLDFGAGAFDGQRRWLEIWVRNDTDGEPGETLAPRQEITAAPYALMAAKVPANSITDLELANGAVTAGKLATGAVTGDNIANGAITNANISIGAIQNQNLAAGSVGATQLSSGAVTGDKLGTDAAFQNLLQNGQSPVGSTGVIMSQLAAAPELLASGYQQISQATLVEEAWSNHLPAPDAPPEFNLPTRYGVAVWTGSEMLIWGGFSSGGGSSNIGGRYNPTTRTWTPMSTVNAPTIRADASAVWTGTEMIVWGGFDGNFLITGGRYNPATDTWTQLNTSGAPTGRRYHTAVWTGSRMVIFGGTTANGIVATGAQYNPANNTWTSSSTPAVARTKHFAFWSASNNMMYVVGGTTEFSTQDEVDRYNPATNTWTTLTPSLAGLGLSGVKAATFTGTEILMAEAGSINAITRYNLANNTMTRVLTDNNTIISDGCSIVWDGTKAVIWGSDNFSRKGGFIYNRNTETLSPISTILAPPNKSQHVAIWTGSRMIVWGGWDGLSGGIYDPVADTWGTVAGLSEGGKRSSGFSQVWTGTDMLIWGGIDQGSRTVQGGRRFNLKTWSIISNTNAPDARVNHSAVWTGTEMIVWGGGTADGEEFFYDGARYNPVTDIWTTLPTLNSPGVELHRAVWTGSEMIVVGIGGSLTQGARYKPATNTWTPLPVSNAPGVRQDFALVWTGTEAILWGGINGTTGNSTGARYNPATNTWTPITAPNPPPGRANPAVAWTGNEMIVYGGGSVSGPYPTVNARYNPTANTWTAINSNIVDARRDMTSVWDGTRLIVWGGKSPSSTYLGWGQLYSPGDDKWSVITSVAEPGARSGAKAVWTGTSMLVFGGENLSGALGATSSYIPERKFYFYVRP